MKIIVCTAVVCVVIGLSVFTNQRTIEAEGRRTRSSLPGMLSNPMADGDSLVSKIDTLNANLVSINKRLTRLEEISSRNNKVDNSELKEISTQISAEVGRMTARLNALSADQAELKVIPSQLLTIDQNMRVILLAKESIAAEKSPPPQEILTTLDWMVQKIDDIDSYFPPLYSFLGAVYSGDASAELAGYPSVDKRLNEVILQLDDLQKDMRTTLKNVTPYIREPGRYPKPFENQ